MLAALHLSQTGVSSDGFGNCTWSWLSVWVSLQGPYFSREADTWDLVHRGALCSKSLPLGHIWGV